MIFRIVPALALSSHMLGEITELPHIGNFIALVFLVAYFISYVRGDDRQ